MYRVGVLSHYDDGLGTLTLDRIFFVETSSIFLLVPLRISLLTIVMRACGSAHRALSKVPIDSQRYSRPRACLYMTKLMRQRGEANLSATT